MPNVEEQEQETKDTLSGNPIRTRCAGVQCQLATTPPVRHVVMLRKFS